MSVAFLLSLMFGLAILVIGADRFVEGAGRLAVHFRIPPLVIGLSLVAFGTSLPELAVSLTAALDGNPGLAVGNVIGSNLANTLLILGVAAVLATLPVTRDSVMRDGLWWMIASVAFLFVAWLGRIGRIEGLMLLAGLALYLLHAFRSGVDFSDEIEDIDRDAMGFDTWMWIVLSLAVVWVGSKLAVHGAVGLAAELGVSDTIVGLTIVAIGTSLPELATTLACLRKGQTDMLIGGIVGSNIFNIFAILGVTGLVATLPVERGLLAFDLPILMVISLAGLLMLRTGWRVTRGEGVVLLSAYAGYLGVSALAL